MQETPLAATDAGVLPDVAPHLEGRKQLEVARPNKEAKGQPALPWMRVPIEIEAGNGVQLAQVQGMDQCLAAGMVSCGYKELFPVQAAAWHTLAGGMSVAHDLCICAPTGSGKTLAYVLPILQGLKGKARYLLGALVVLPTRELAAQVFSVFAALSPAMGIWTGLAAARLALPAEAAALSETPPNVLVATPGRLMAHLKAAQPTFSIDRLRFLVVDETDRLLRQAYQDWLPHVIAATSSGSPTGTAHRGLGDTCRPVKIVVSATLTQDPGKIRRLDLHAPRYIAMSAADHRYKVPKQLKEFKLVGAATDKPLLLVALLQHLRPARTIVFTASRVSTHRLCVLLAEMPGFAAEVAEHSSTAAGRRGESPGLSAFKAHSARILVASDALTRGMDVPNVDVIINYDPPVYAKTYVHRAGRTARAGQQGQVITILRNEEVRHFKSMLRKVDNTFVKDFALPRKLVGSLQPEYQQAVESAAERLEGHIPQ